MWEDPIVADVHRVREEIAAEFGFSVESFFADLMKRQEALGNRLVRPGRSAEPTVNANRTREADFSAAAPSGTAPAA